MLHRLIFILLFAVSLPTYAVVWIETQQWSPQFEKTYEEWVKKEWNIDYFSREKLPSGEDNPFYGLKSDCADTVYSMRIIFSFYHQLPFVAVDPTSGTRKISNRMKRWDSLPTESQRLREFLIYSFDIFSTNSLPNDTYPLAINRQTVHAGALMMTVEKNHHSWTIKDILSIGVPHLVFNSSIGPTSGSTLQQRTSWPNPAWVFEENFTPQGNGGLRYWRYPEDLDKPVWEVPGYSEEQYQIPLEKWIDVVQAKLALVVESNEQKMVRLVENACVGAQSRIKVVKEGLEALKQINRCMNYQEFDTYSTPNRDQRVFDDLMALRRSYKNLVLNGHEKELPPTLIQQLNKIFPAIQKTVSVEQAGMPPQAIDGNSICIFQYGSGLKMDLAEYRRRSFGNLLSNNPNDDFDYRWGEKPGPSERSKTCEVWDTWSPNLPNED